MMLYFAYGSNMDEKHMKERCPYAQFVAVARLPEHRLLFPPRLPVSLSGRGCVVVQIVVLTLYSVR